MKITRRNFILGGAASMGALATAPLLSSCSSNAKTKSGLNTSDFESNGTATINPAFSETYTAKEATKLIVLKNDAGSEVCITNFGARIVSCMVPDKNNDFKDIVLGFSNIKDYVNALEDNNVMGAMVGRTIDRISNAKFSIDGKEYKLDKNFKGIHNMHGGRFGWQHQTWNLVQQTSNSACLNLVSPDEDGGYPGEVNFYLTYTLTDDNSLMLESKATTTKKTPLNVVNHAYFNLEGDPNKTIHDYEIRIYGNKYIDVGENAIPNGKILSIPTGDLMDFYSKTNTIQQNLDLKTGIWRYTKGYDFAYILDEAQQVKASAYSSKSGIKVDLITDRPNIHLYDAHDLDGTYVGKNNIKYDSCCALCLEAEAPPDAINHNNFYNTVISPNETYQSTTKYKFSVA